MIKIAIIGTGGMGNAHADSYRKIKGVALTACCDISKERATAFAEKFKIPAVYTDYRELLEKEDIDGVSNVTVDAMHAPISLAVIAKKIAILCEKPLATTLADARKMRDAARRSRVINMVNFSYRNSCGLQAAARYVAAGKIGRIMHVESSYLQSWLAQPAWGDWHTNPAWQWRLSTRHGSAGVLGDIGCHIYDLTTFLCGDLDSLYCRVKTFDKGIKGNRIGEFVLDANDSFVSNVTLAGGGIGTIHATRWATGHHNSLRCRVYGDKGAVEVDLDRSYESYRVIAGRPAMLKADWKVVKARPTPNNYERFVAAIRSGRNDVSDFANGCKIQAYLHSSLESSRLGKPVTIKA
jgi:predicted dehydrogenase